MSELRTAKESLRDAMERYFRGSDRKMETVRIEVPAPAVDLPRWLIANPCRPRIYWSDRAGEFEMAGIGDAGGFLCGSGRNFRAVLSHMRKSGHFRQARLRYFGGRSFNGPASPGSSWAPFGGVRFILPRFEISRSADVWRLSCNFSDDPSIPSKTALRPLMEDLARLRTGLATTPPLPPVMDRKDHPDRSGWIKGVEGVLDGIARGYFQKVVLARKSVFRFEAPLEPFLLLHRLREMNPAAFHFAFQPEDGAAFLGASPERLYRRHERRITTEAVAGTRRRGDSAREDLAIGDALLDSDKDRREHRFVADIIADKLGDLCEEHWADPKVSLLKFARLQHLYQRFEGILRADVDDADLIAAIHPTPAVAGNSTAAAMTEIARWEPFHRGWYAGPVGWISPRGAEFAVAIRSGLAVGERLNLFAGAGIVEGSRPLAEWEELENKLACFVRAIGVS